MKILAVRRFPVREQDVLRAVKDFLEVRGFRIWRRNTGGAYALRMGGERFVRFSEPGAADLTGWQIGTGRAIEVEIKRPGSRTNPKRDAMQKAWLDRARRDGVIALRVASVLEADQQLEAFGFKRRLLL